MNFQQLSDPAYLASIVGTVEQYTVLFQRISDKVAELETKVNPYAYRRDKAQRALAALQLKVSDAEAQVQVFQSKMGALMAGTPDYAAAELEYDRWTVRLRDAQTRLASSTAEPTNTLFSDFGNAANALLYDQFGQVKTALQAYATTKGW